METRKQKREFLLAAIRLLLEDHGYRYTQVALVAKLQYLGAKVSRSLLSNAVSGRPVSDPSLWALADGLGVIVKSELGLVYDPATQQFVALRTEGWQPVEIPVALPAIHEEDTAFVFHQSGRLSIAEKVAFINQATRDVSVLGVRLNQFCQYFYNRSDAEFKDHIEALLARGVNLYCYLLNPDSNAAKFYFANRAKSQREELYGEATIRPIVEKLVQVRQGFLARGHAGQMHILLMERLPDTNFTVVDADAACGQLLASNYMQGVARGKTPVVQVARARNPKLFEVYLSAFNAARQDARRVE